MTNATASQGTHVVVVVEDEAAIRIVVCQALTDAGFDVVEAEHADAAIAVLHTRAEDINALFTDIHMPGSIDGLKLAHLTCGNWPWIALLITSGLAHPEAEALPKGSRFVPKPYRPAAVVAHLREILAA